MLWGLPYDQSVLGSTTLGADCGVPGEPKRVGQVVLVAFPSGGPPLAATLEASPIRRVRLSSRGRLSPHYHALALESTQFYRGVGDVVFVAGRVAAFVL